MTQPSGDGERRIVVGVDGSASSTAALAWAVKQAALTGALVDAVIAWEVPANYSFLVQVPVDINYAEIAAQVAADAIAEVSGPGEPVKIRSTPTRAARRRCCWMRQREPSCWWSAAAGTADSPKPCSARSASTASTTPRVPSW